MKLPNNREAFVSEHKLKNYLLSPAHPVGRAKARFFQKVGFSLKTVQRFKEVLLEIAANEDVVDTISTAHGVKYVIDGKIKALSGKEIHLRTVWIVEIGINQPRLVTVYPLRRSND